MKNLIPLFILLLGSILITLPADAQKIGVFGVNTYGQFGDGTTSTSQNYTSVTILGTDTDWNAIGCGYYHSLALKTNGTLWAWGRNNKGQLGDGTTADKTVPTQVGTATNWKQFDGGQAFTAAVQTDGTLWAWGDNSQGQLGDGTTVDQTSPIQIGTATDWVQVDCGAAFVIAIKADGTLWAWGNNSQGQLGNGNTTNLSTPTQIGTEHTWWKVAAHSTRSTALKTDGSWWWWGASAGGVGTIPAQIGLAGPDSYVNISVCEELIGAVTANGVYKQLGNYFWSLNSKKCVQCGIEGTRGIEEIVQIALFNPPATLPSAKCSGNDAMAVTAVGQLWRAEQCISFATNTPTTQISSDLSLGKVVAGSEHFLVLQGTNPTLAGTIGSDQSIASNTTPAAFTNVTSPSGETGMLEYQWQKSTTSNSAGFGDISGATSITFTETVALTQTTWYKRMTKVTNQADWLASNVVKVTIQPLLVSTQAPTAVTETSATGNGNITDICGANATNRGVIWYPYSGTDKTIGEANVTNVSETGDFGAGAFTASLTGLSVNTRYDARAHATNTSGTGYGARVDFWTLAKVPDAPTVDNPAATSLDVTVNLNGNPAATEFAIHETTQSKFVQANGTLGASAVWLTAALWGTKTVTGLTTGSTYTFEVKARNSVNTETAYGATANGTATKPPMQLKFTTTTASQSIALPLYGTVNCTVNWGDGPATQNFTTTGLKPHTYVAAGIYTVSISGSLTRFGDEVNGWTGAGYLTEVVDFGTVGLTALWGAFINANNLTSVPTTLPATVTNLQYTFKNNGRATIANLNLWDVGNVTDMFSMFENATAFNQSLGNWNVSNVGNMDYMFSGASSFDQNLGSWNIEQVLGMEDMFKGVTLSPANYDALLTGWAALTAQNGVTFNGGNSKYTCGAASARQILITDDEWTIIDGGALLITWDGSESSDWNVAANWSCNTVPTATDNVTIPHVTNDPVVNLAAASPAVCNNLTIESGAVLTIPAGKALTVNGTLTNNAGITGLVVKSASDASDGTGVLLNGTAGVLGTVERYVSGNLWHLISPAATAGETVASFVLLANGNLVARNTTNYALSPWNEETGKWAYYKVAGTNSDLFGSPAQGFQVMRADGAGTGTGSGPVTDNGKLTFKGTLAAANINILVTKTGYGWNLVGNPYPCALDVDKFLTENTLVIDPSYLYIYVSKIADITAYGYDPNTAGLKLASGEGFFVKSVAGGGTVKFTPAMKSSVADAFKAATVDNPTIQLTVEDGNGKLGTTIQYIGGATKGLDPGKDAGLFYGTASTFSLFTRLIEDNGVDFTVQALPDNNLESMVVPVGLVAEKGAIVTFNAKATNLPAGYQVVLEDKGTGIFTRLDEANSSYTVSLEAASNGTGRFYLHTTETVSAIDNALLNEFKVITMPEQHLVRILGNFDLPARAMVYDMNGKLVATSALTAQIENTIALNNCATGVYLLKVESGKGVETKKFSWKRK